LHVAEHELAVLPVNMGLGAFDDRIRQKIDWRVSLPELGLRTLQLDLHEPHDGRRRGAGSPISEQ
jgi:hypothetical protein